MKRVCVTALGFSAIAVLLGAAPSGETLVLVPFANLAGAERAPDVIEAAISARLSTRGYRLVRGDEVRAFLDSERVRYVDSLSGPVREKLLAAFRADGVILGAICAFVEGENPVVGISLRLLDAQGRTAWSSAVGLTGDDTEGALALKRVASVDLLAEKAVRRVLRNFPSPGGAGRISGARGKPLGESAPRTYRSAALASGRQYRIYLLPLENRTRERVASRLVGELLARRLAASDLFDVIEPSDFRSAMVAAKLTGLKGGDPEELKKLGSALGTTLVLTGTIYQYRDASSRGGEITPELELQLTLTDVATGEIVWTSSVARKGADYSGLLQLGAISNMTSLADQVAAEMVHAAEKAHGKRPQAAGRSPKVSVSRSGP
jgi:hypothetical protein